MKWIRRLFLLIAVLIVGVVGAAIATARSSEHPVGFQMARATGANGQPFAVAIWYPTQASPRPTTWLGLGLMNVAPDAPVSGTSLPMIVISHGNGAGPASHADLAMALADAGYVVAAPMHRGDNFADQSAAGSAMLFSGRNAELRSTIDFILKTWPARIQVDPQRIGAYGMSAGGFTVLTAAGAEPDFTSIASHCKQAPEFICDVLRQVDSPLLMENGAKSGGPFAADARIKAAVIAAPGLGFTLVPDGLAKVQAPIQIWSGDQDVKTPYATNAKLVRDALGSKAEFHQVAGAGHFSFLAPCGLLAPPELCAEKGAFDRKAFHKEMNTSVVRFFNKYLGGS